MPGTREGLMGRTEIVGIFALLARLNLGLDAVKSCPQRLLGRGKHHFVLNFGSIGGPDRMKEKKVCWVCCGSRRGKLTN